MKASRTTAQKPNTTSTSPSRCQSPAWRGLDMRKTLEGAGAERVQERDGEDQRPQPRPTASGAPFGMRPRPSRVLAGETGGQRRGEQFSVKPLQVLPACGTSQSRTTEAREFARCGVWKAMQRPRFGNARSPACRSCACCRARILRSRSCLSRRLRAARLAELRASVCSFGITPWNPPTGLSFALILLFGGEYLPWLFVAPVARRSDRARLRRCRSLRKRLSSLIIGGGYGAAALLLLIAPPPFRSHACRHAVPCCG